MRKKGFTLIEVIISIAILGIISVSILSIFNMGLINIRRAGIKTQNTNSAVTNIDNKILYSDTTQDGVEERNIDVKLPGVLSPIDVDGKIIIQNIEDELSNIKNLETFVPD